VENDELENHQEYHPETLDDLKIIKQALQLSAHVINQYPKQLAGQLTGRLLLFEKQPTIQKLLQQISQTKIPWLRPLTASLIPPGNGLIRTLIGHSSRVNAVAVSSDGKYVVSGSDDNTIKVWDFSTGNGIHTLNIPLTAHSYRVNVVAVSSDGKYIVSAAYDDTIKVWKLVTKEIHTLSGHRFSVNAVALSSDGKYVVSGSGDNTIKIWELATGKKIHTLTGHNDCLNAVAVSNDGKYVVSGSHDKTIKVWELATGKEIRTLTGHSSCVYAVAVSSDGKYIVSGSDDGKIKVWQCATAKEMLTFTGESKIRCCAITPDGAKIIAGDYLGKLHFLRLEGIELQS